MKKYLLLLAAVSVTSLFIIFGKSFQHKNKIREVTGEENPITREVWEHDRIVDPATGEIPSMGLWNAYLQLVSEGKMPGQPFISKANQRDASWQLVNDFFSSIAITKITYDPNNTQTFYFCTGEGWYNADASI